MTRLDRPPGRVKLLRLLRERGPAGAHTVIDIRRGDISGDPAARRLELIDRGFRIRSEADNRDGTHGARYTLEHDAGDARAWMTDKHLNLESAGVGAVGGTNPSLEGGADSGGSAAGAPPLPDRGSGPAAPLFDDDTGGSARSAIVDGDYEDEAA